jgi:hypothetical protein
MRVAGSPCTCVNTLDAIAGKVIIRSAVSVSTARMMPTETARSDFHQPRGGTVGRRFEINQSANFDVDCHLRDRACLETHRARD